MNNDKPDNFLTPIAWNASNVTFNFSGHLPGDYSPCLLIISAYATHESSVLQGAVCIISNKGVNIIAKTSGISQVSLSDTTLTVKLTSMASSIVCRVIGIK